MQELGYIPLIDAMRKNLATYLYDDVTYAYDDVTYGMCMQTIDAMRKNLAASKATSPRFAKK